MLQAILVGAIGLAGTILVAAVTSVVTWRVSDYGRKADLYKIVYPEKLRVAQEIMQRAAELHRDVWQLVWNDEADARDAAAELYRGADALFHDVQAQEWLLGPSIKGAATRLHEVLRQSLAAKVFKPSEPHVEGVFEIDENAWEPVSGYLAAFEALQQAVRGELRIEELGRTFPPGRRLEK